MNQQEKQALKQIMQREIAALSTEIAEYERSLKPIKKDCSLDSIDHKMLKQEQDITLQRYEVAKKRLHRLQTTYNTIDNQTYDICQECEEAIPLERLKLMPESQYCVACMNELGL